MTTTKIKKERVSIKPRLPSPKAGSFIFVFPLMLLAGGMSKYRGWITICLSLQLWPPLFAMLNMMIDTAYDPAHIVSYSAWSTEVKRMDAIASIAANLTLLIPVLAVYVTRMGEGGFLHIAGSLMAANQSAVAAASAEQTSGGRSYDNSSIDNSNRSNVNENKYDNSRQFVSGINSGINMDGSMQKILPNGNVITVGGGGTTSSVGEASYRGSEGVSTSLHEGRREEVQIMNSEAASLSKAKESLISQEASAMYSIAQNTRNDSGYDIDTSTDEGREVTKALNAVDRMKEGNDYSWRQNAEAYLKGEASPPIIGKIASFLGFSASAGGEARAGNESSQSATSSLDLVDESSTSNRNSINFRSSEHSALLESYGIDKGQQDSMRETYNETTRLEQSIATHKDNIEGYNKAIDHVKSHNAEYSKDMTQDVIDAYKKTYGVSDQEAGKVVLDGREDAQRIFRQISSAKADSILQQVRSKGEQLNNSDTINRFMEVNKDAVNNKPGEVGGLVDSFAREHGMASQNKIKEDLEAFKNDLKKSHEDRRDFVSNNYNDTRDVNLFKQKNSKQNIEKLEEDRIGNGKIATLGGLTNGLGRPSYKPKMNNVEEDTKPMQQAVRPVEEFTTKDISDTRRLMDEFKSDNNLGREDTSLAKGANQYIDPTKKTKG